MLMFDDLKQMYTCMYTAVGRSRSLPQQIHCRRVCGVRHWVSAT